MVIRKSLVGLGLFSVCLIAGAQNAVTVAQLEQTLAADHGKSDKELAQQIGKMELTQRLATAHAALLQADLPGEKSRLALEAVADASAFLALPAAEILPTAPPDRAAQKAILSRAIDFVLSTVPSMPHFFATRETTRLERVKPEREVTLDTAETSADSSPKEPFHLVDTSLVTVEYREGKEVIENPDEKKKGERNNGLNNWGEFGPLLGLVMSDILAGRIGWLHWEQGADGPVAVFRYKIDRSHYIVRYCCLPDPDPKKRNLETVPPYDGEIAIDPKTGSVLRLVLETELDRNLPIKRDDVMVEYGPVQIGGVSYICPLKSVSITHEVSALNFMSSGIAPALRGGSKSIHIVEPAETTAINDVAFTHYHRFRAELRLVPENPDESTPEITPPSKPPVPPNR
jgi:hypothetical protein